MDKNIYISHATSFDYKELLYKPLRNSSLNKDYNLIFPHENSNELYDSEGLFKDNCFCVIAEVSNPSFGVGIELECARNNGVQVFCFYKKGISPSKSLDKVATALYEYKDEKDLVYKIERLFGECKRKEIFIEQKQRQINMCKGNVKLLKEKIKNMDIEYIDDVVLLTELCGGFGSVEFEIIGYQYIEGYPTLITNRVSSGLSGNGITVSELILILGSLSDSDTLCIKTGFSNDDSDTVYGILNCIAHNSYDLKSEETKKVYGLYAFELTI